LRAILHSNVRKKGTNMGKIAFDPLECRGVTDP
jgi:hypothetical protein